MTYYVDPGTTKGCAVARSWQGGVIGLAMYQGRKPVKAWGDWSGAPDVTYWEKPQLYPHELRSSAPQVVIAKANALIDLSACGADTARALAGPYDVHEKRPREWKGQIPKPIHHGRALLRLTAFEASLLNLAYSGPSLVQYVAAAATRKAKNDDSGYKSEIVDLLDAVAFCLTIEGRL